MREILFRGKRKDTGDWAYGFLYVTHNGEYEIGAYDPKTNIERMTSVVDGETVGQYTGLTDKNDTRIFEGDIVKLYDGTEDLYEIRRECDTPGGYWAETGFILKRIGWSGYIHFTDTIDDWENECQVVVVGNIHDNPELLKARENDA